jgi:hypothetical protein
MVYHDISEILSDPFPENAIGSREIVGDIKMIYIINLHVQKQNSNQTTGARMKLRE